MLLLLLISGFICFTFFTVGKFFLIAIHESEGLIFTDFLFVGMALVNSYFTIFSLFFKTDYKPTLILFCCCCLMPIILKINNKGFQAINFYVFNTNKKVILLTMPIAFLMLLLASSSPFIYDTGVYHIQAIMWIHQYAVVPGLGNLHGRLAFNPNTFNLEAGFSFTEVFKQSIFAVNSFFCIALFHYFISLFTNSRLSIKFLFFLLLVSIFFILYLGTRIASPTPDIISSLLPFYIFIRYIEEFFKNKKYKPFANSNMIPVLIILSVYLVTVKLSALPLLLFPFLVILKNKHLLNKNNIVFTLISVLIIILPWLIRNYFLSGYLIYPIREIDIFNPNWKIPLSSVNIERQYIYDWARISLPNYADVPHMTFFEWFPVWFNTGITWQILLMLSFVSPILVAVLYLRNGNKKNYNDLLIIWLVSYLSTCFWFLTAPDVRFAQSYIITSALIFLLFTDFLIIKFVKFLKFKKYLPLLFVTLIFYKQLEQMCRNQDLINKTSLFMPVEPENRIIYDVKNILIIGGKMKFAEKKIQYTSHKIGNFNLIVPVKDDRCYNQPLPCAPDVKENLILRGQTLQEGFRINYND